MPIAASAFQRQDQSVQLMRKRKRVDYGEDKYSYMDDENYGKNPEYDTQIKAYAKQQRKKRKLVKEDPNATEITYAMSTGEEQTLTVRTLEWMGENWENIKGNTEWGTYAISINVGDDPFYFRANNTMDVGFSPMSLGNSTAENITYTSSKARKFTDIGAELDQQISTAKKSDQPGLRAEIGRSIYDAIKSRGKATANLVGLDSDSELLVKELIAELAAIWIIDLYRSEGNDKEILKHQKKLLTGKKSFTAILKPGVYMGMSAKDLR